ncbi:MAG: pyridoxal phosphate-dependent aminotransferase [Candidatus Saganbacteria bacterium]|nr:pyridoxal phosphate-dependent aminotransferase [Candidatus Saganbacteria bacterium]
MRKKTSQLVSKLLPSPTLTLAAKVNALKAQGVPVLGLTAGEPHLPTPPHIISAAHKAMLDGKTRYTATAGIPELRKAIAEFTERKNRVKYDPMSQVIVNVGGKQALFEAFLAICDPGDEVILIAPYWPTYAEQVKAAGATPKVIYTDEAKGFKVTPEQLKQAIAKQTKVVLLNSPSNPAGVLYSRKELEALGQVILSYSEDTIIISDEVYDAIVFDGEFTSISSLSPELAARTLVINACSKTYSMTGWRLGWACGDKEIIKAMGLIQDQNTSNPTSFVQYAALAALTGPQDFPKQLVVAYRERAEKALKIIAEMGFTCVKPGGAFYIFPNVSSVKMKPEAGKSISETFSMRLLEEAKVAVVDGAGFGAPNNVRISLATTDDYLKALNTMKDYVLSL